MDRLEKLNENLISVIIPVFNGEKHLPECLESVLNQTYQNLEIIIIDDGSGDDTNHIIDDYSNRDNHIIPMRIKERCGTSEARNRGIKAAKGDYICFIDGDDVVSTDYIETLFYEMNDEVDVVCGGYFSILNDMYNVLGVHPLPNKIYKTVDESYNIFSKCMAKSVAMQVVWGKLFKKELFTTILFEPFIIGEDEVLIVRIMALNKVVKTISYVGYYYRSHMDSVSGRSGIKKERIKSEIRAKYLIAQIMENVSEYCKKQSKENFKRGVLNIIYRIKRWENNKVSFLANSKTVRKNKKILFRMHNLSFKEKIIILTYSYCPRLLWKIL